MSDSTNSGGLGLIGVLVVVFIVLKLVGVIAWSWVWVLSPLWIELGLIFFILLVGWLGKRGGDMPKDEPPWTVK